MITYLEDGDLAIYDGLKFRKDKRTGYYLNAKTHKRLHVYVWESANGEIPKGYHIHHKDFDKTNNDISNLEMMTMQEHEKLHGEMLSEDRRQQLRENLLKNAQPAAIKWHGSAEGRKWHSENAKRIFENLAPIKYICTYCGKEYESLKRYGQEDNTFCSNNCRSAYRRKSGVDNVEKTCEICGGKYTANKYAKTKYCESCKSEVHRRRGRRRRVQPGSC